MRIVQANINHARRAQDLILQAMAERGAGLAIIAEPWKIPDRHPCWATNAERSAAIHWRRTKEQQVPCCKKGEGPGWVMVEWGPLLVIGVYLRPSLSRAELEERLDDLEAQVNASLPRPILVAGDFNAKSALWGSRRPDCKGGVGDRHHLDFPCGGEDHYGMESGRGGGYPLGSPHVGNGGPTNSNTKGRAGRLRRPLRWATKKIDPDKLQASLAAELWIPRKQLMHEGDIEEETRWLRQALTRACDQAMPRAAYSARRATYWWTQEIGDL
ncbi:PREDICTED: uncharacterized protein LOC105568116, partial [Vollenhovia emeryi]|uniref:uncharacterized protein LOC105568116 n=1 Tax=Vollenhovia emeryi TaxID=411798 RepID=UPI0005F4FEBC